MARVGVLLFLLARSSVAGEDNPVTEELKASAAAAQKAASPGWNKFVLSSNDCTDAEVRVAVDRYDDAIDLYQQAEDAGAKDVGPAIIMLARRAAKLRAFLFWRDMKRKRAESPVPESKKPKPASKKSGTPKSGADPAPPVPETSLRRSSNIQAARRFVMHHFQHRKRATIVPSCRNCAARGSLQPPRKYDPYTKTWGPWPARVRCTLCSGQGRHFKSEAARASYWMTLTPLTRQSPEAKKWWRKREQHWNANRRTIPWISRFQIRSVDYRGLLADVTWREWGAEGMREETRRLIRLGGRWYFYTPAYDAALYELLKKSD